MTFPIEIKAETLPTILAVFGCLMILMGLIDPRLAITGFVIILIAVFCHLIPYSKNKDSK